GGEKARIALAKVLLSKANFLLLDEPTNHLDMATVSMLVDVLNDYEGSFLVVSHDRHFLSCVANRIWWIEDQHLRTYEGSYEEYEEWKTRQLKAEAVAEKKQPVQQKVEKPKLERSDEEKKQRQRTQKKFDKLEEELEQLRQSRHELENLLARPEVYSDPGKFQDHLDRFNRIDADFQAKTREWEELFEQLSGME
nr:ATP-binding cassette domain-containing protein [Bacteroidia bacterium]